MVCINWHVYDFVMCTTVGMFTMHDGLGAYNFVLSYWWGMCVCVVWNFVVIGVAQYQYAMEFAELFGSRDPSGDSREKTILYIDLLVAVDRLSDALAATRTSKHSEHDMELFNCLLDKCQQGLCL